MFSIPIAGYCKFFSFFPETCEKINTIINKILPETSPLRKQKTSKQEFENFESNSNSKFALKLTCLDLRNHVHAQTDLMISYFTLLYFI